MQHDPPAFPDSATPADTGFIRSSFAIKPSVLDQLQADADGDGSRVLQIGDVIEVYVGAALDHRGVRESVQRRLHALRYPQPLDTPSPVLKARIAALDADAQQRLLDALDAVTQGASRG